MDNQNNRNNKDPNKNNKQGFSFVIIVTILTAMMVFALYQFQGFGKEEEEISYNEFLIHRQGSLSFFPAWQAGGASVSVLSDRRLHPYP